MDKFNQDEPVLRRVAIYVRVSTTEQKIDGYGQEAQINRLIDYIDNNKAQNFQFNRKWIYEDVHTGSDINRPKLGMLLKDIKAKKFDAVLVWKIDRLSRNLMHLMTIFEEFERNNVSFISVQENINFNGPIGKLFFQIFGAFAQFERELIKGRTHGGIIASAEMGNYTGTFNPYGYKPVKNPNGKGKRLELIEVEKKIVDDIFDMYIYDQLGYGEIAAKLNKLRTPLGKYSKSSKNGKWTEIMVNNIIINELYAGRYIANKKDDSGRLLAEEDWTVVKVPAAISELKFQQAQRIRGSKRPIVNNNYLLSGLIKDTTLNPPKPFVGCKRTKGGFSYRRKKIKDQSEEIYGTFEVPGRQLEEYVWTKLMNALKEPESFIKHYFQKYFGDSKKVENIQKNIDENREKLAELEMEINRIEDAFEKGHYSQDKMATKLQEKQQQQTEILGEISDLTDELLLVGSKNSEISKLKDAAVQVKYRLESLDIKQKKILLQLFVDRIELIRNKREDNKWNITVKLIFRFNPNKFPFTLLEGSTGNPNRYAKKPELSSNSGQHGGPAWT